MRPRVIIVDDDRSTVRLLAEVLSPDFDVIAIADHFGRMIGADIYANTIAAVVDLLLGIDVTGCELLTYLQEHHPHVRRIAMTASRHNGSTIDCPAAQHLLLKPFEMDDLYGCIAG